MLRLYKNPLVFDNRKCDSAGNSGSALAAGISAVSNVVGNWLQGKTSKKLMREQMHWQEVMYDKQLADNRTNWQMQNWYNSPAHQRQLLEEAGYNPSMMSDNLQNVSSADNISSANLPSAPSYTPVPNLLASAVSSATAAYVSLKNADVNQQNANTNAKNAGTAAYNAETGRFTWQTSNNYYQHLNQLTREQIGIAAQENAFKSEYLQTQINQMRASQNLTNVQISAQRILNNFLPQEKAAQLANMAAQYDQILEDIRLKKVNESVARAQMQNLEANTRFVLSQNDRYQQETPIEVSNMQQGRSNDWQTRESTTPISVSGNVHGLSIGGSASFTASKGTYKSGLQMVNGMMHTLRKSLNPSQPVGNTSPNVPPLSRGIQ